MTRTIEYIPIEDLKENPRNVKDHEIPTVTASISRFGVIDAIVVDARTGYIVSGHGRRQTLLNMRDAGELPPEGVILEGEGKNRTWLVPVLTGWSSRSDTEAEAALIALNRTTELGGWDNEALLSALDELSTNTGGLVGVGFDESDIEDLRTQLEEVEDFDPDPEHQELPGTKGIEVVCPHCGEKFEV